MLRLLFWKAIRSNTVLIVSTALSFIIGLLLSTIIEQLIVSRANLLDRIIQGAIFGVLILLLIFITLQFRNLQDILRRQRLSVQVDYASTKAQDRQLYQPVNEAIISAKKNIRVVGMFRPNDLPHKEGRKGYYDVLKEMIDLKVQLNQPFIYERIVQVEEVTSGLLRSNQIDPITYEHCRQILDWKKQKSAVSAQVKQFPNILGALSFLIVDDDRFVMVIPDIGRSDDGTLKLEGLQLGLNFEDGDGILTEPMKSFFARIFNEADTVVRLEDDAGK